MSEEQSLGNKLIEALGIIIPESHKEELKKQAEAVAEHSMKGLEQLKKDVENMASSSKKLTEDALTNLEKAFVEFQTNAEQLRQKRLEQGKQLYNNLGAMLDKLRNSDISAKINSDLQKQTDDLMALVKACEDKLSEEVISRAKSLVDSYKEASVKQNQDFRSALNNLLESITTAETTLQK